MSLPGDLWPRRTPQEVATLRARAATPAIHLVQPGPPPSRSGPS